MAIIATLLCKRERMGCNYAPQWAKVRSCCAKVPEGEGATPPGAGAIRIKSTSSCERDAAQQRQRAEGANPPRGRALGIKYPLRNTHCILGNAFCNSALERRIPENFAIIFWKNAQHGVEQSLGATKMRTDGWWEPFYVTRARQVLLGK